MEIGGEAWPSCLFEAVPDEVLLRLLSFLDPESLRVFGATCRALSTLVVHECFRLGVRYQRRRFLDEALAFFSVTLALDPRHLAALDERAICFFNVGDRRSAVRDLRRSAALAQSPAEKKTYESVALEMTGRLQEALAAAREALALDAACGRAYFELAYVLQVGIGSCCDCGIDMCRLYLCIVFLQSFLVSLSLSSRSNASR